MRAMSVVVLIGVINYILLKEYNVTIITYTTLMVPMWNSITSYLK